MTAQTHFLEDILRQPAEIRRAIEYLLGPGKSALDKARSLIQSTRDVIITGIGASWHAALRAGALLNLDGNHALILEASELLYFATVPRGAVIVAISRTGRSVEIVRLLDKAEASCASV